MKLFSNRLVRFVLTLVTFVAVWNLVIWLISVLFTKDTYFFEPITCLALPLVIAVVLGYRFISVKNRNNCKSDISTR